MFPLEQRTSSLALGAIILGLALAVIPFLDRNDSKARTAVLLITVVLAWRYVVWRFTATIPSFDASLNAFVAWGFAILEGLTVLSSTLASLLLCRTKDRSQEATVHAAWWGSDAPPRLDVYIATYNEDLSILERTIVGAKALSHPAVRIFVLDDGRRPALEELCQKLAVEYRTRPDNAHAKAGNINYTFNRRMADPDVPGFIAVLDADFIPHPDFASRSLALFHDPGVALVQTPQHFFNPDPIQHNLGISSGYPDEQRFFFDHLEPSRDAWTIAVCCGTSSVLRSAALQQIGGFPTASVTEDFLVTLRLDENGWRTVYLNEPLTEGLAPEGLQEYIVQRGRWCLGMMQIVRDVYSPFGRHNLRLIQRLSVFDSLLYWTTTFSFRLASLACPLLYWYFGLMVVDASIADISAYFIPYYVAVLASLNWISRGMIVPLLNDTSQLLAAWPIVRATVMGLFTPGPHKFKVTAKGGDRRQTVVQWPLLRPFLILFLLTLGGLLIGLISPQRFSFGGVAGDGLQVVLFWTLYNLVLLAVTMLACVERPRDDRPQRAFNEASYLIVDGQSVTAWVSELGAEQARLRGPAQLPASAATQLALSGVGLVHARILSETSDGYRLRLEPTPEQRREIIRRLHTAPGAPGTAQGSLGQMVRQLGRMFAR